MVKILDSTLREGEQTPGVSFDVHIKVAIAELLNEIGIDVIEAGHPVVSSEISEGIKNVVQRKFNSIIGAHARSIKRDVDFAVECGVGFIGIFYCVSNERLNYYSKELNRAIETICEVIRYARERDMNLLIRYTPEDAVRSCWENVITAAEEAVKAGADIISIADTTGFMVPGTSRSMYDYVKRIKDTLAHKGLNPMIEVHCHNDRGLALANAIDGFRAGADIIDASVLSLGERTGIVDLASLLSILVIDMEVKNRWNLKKLMDLYELVARYSKIPIPVNAPIIGKNSFTHCAGVHTHAAISNPIHYQSIDPQKFGRESKISLDQMSGIASVKRCMEEINEDSNDRDFLVKVLSKVKDVGKAGRIVDKNEFSYIVKYLKIKENY